MRRAQRRREVTGLVGVLRDLAQKADRMTEASLRHEFVQAVREFVRQATGYEPTVLLEERVLRGHSDARLGGLVFEFKTPRVALDEVVGRCLGYLRDYREEGLTARGVAYNGVEMALLSETGAEVWQGRAEDGATLLEAWALLLALRVVDPQHLILTLGFPSPMFQDATN